MATKRNFDEATADDQPEPKRDRKTDVDSTTENGKVSSKSESSNDCNKSSDSEVACKSRRDSVALMEAELENGNVPARGMHDNNSGKSSEIEEAGDVEIEYFIGSDQNRQQKGKSEFSGSDLGPKFQGDAPEASGSSGHQRNPKSHADPGRSGLKNPKSMGPASVASSSKSELDTIKKNSTICQRSSGPEKCGETSSDPSVTATIGDPAADGIPIVTNPFIGKPGRYDIVQLLAEDRKWGLNWCLETEKDVLSKGRPTPTLRESDTIADPKTGVVISLSDYTYRKIPWLTGSKILGKYFCWPCLLFSTKEKWSLPGNAGWKDSSVAILHHQVSAEHVASCRTFKERNESLRKLKSGTALSAASDPNFPTRKNRRLFELLIHILCSKSADWGFDGCNELMKVAMLHDPELGDLSKKQFKEGCLVDFVSSHAEKLRTSVEFVVKSSIRKEIIRASHLCVTYEDTVDVVDKSSVVAVIVRYVNIEGEACERFLRFVKLSGPRTAANFLTMHSALMSELGVEKKVAGYSYSGTIVQPSDAKDLKDAMRTASPKSKYFHCPDHNFKQFLLQSLSHVEKSRPFFHVIQNLVEFFSNNNGAIPTLVNFVKTSDPKVPWSLGEHSFTHDMILTLKHIYRYVLLFFERVLKKFWKDEVVRLAPQFLAFLRCRENKFLISLVSRVLAAVEDLARDIEMNAQSHRRALLALSQLQDLKTIGPTQSMFAALDGKLSSTGPERSIHQDLSRNLCKQLFDDIVDTAIDCVSQKCHKPDPLFYLSQENREFASLAKDLILMQYFCHSTPGAHMAILREQLESFKAYELIFHKKTVQEHVKLMMSLDMSENFSVLHNYLRFSILVTASENNPSGSAISRLKAYIRDKQLLSQNEVLLFLEKEWISKSIKDGQFVDAIIRNYECNFVLNNKAAAK